MKKANFLAVGAFAILSTFANMAHADIPVTEQEVNIVKTVFEKSQRNIQQTLEYHYNTPFFNSPSGLNVGLAFNPEGLNEDVVEKLKVLVNKQSISHKTSNKAAVSSNSPTITDESALNMDIKISGVTAEHYRNNYECQINMYIGPKGEILKATPVKETLKITKLMNERQYEIAQKLVLLHEYSHCEFGNIESPVIIPGHSKKSNIELSYILKDHTQSNFGDIISYVGLLNENYADINAIYSLIREYGVDDPDLNYVINAMKIQRQDNYFNKDVDTHFSHLGITEALKPENIKKMLEITTIDEMNEHVLKIANTGTLKVLADRPEIEEKVFSKNTLMLSVISNYLEIANNQYNDKEKRSLYSRDVSRGFTYNLASNLIDKVNFETDDPAQKYVELLSYISTNFNLEFGFWDNIRLEKAYKKTHEIKDYTRILRNQIDYEYKNSESGNRINEYRSYQRHMNLSEAKKQMIIMRSSVVLHNNSLTQPKSNF